MEDFSQSITFQVFGSFLKMTENKSFEIFFCQLLCHNGTGGHAAMLDFE